MEINLTDRVQLEQFDEQCLRYGRHIGISVDDCPALRVLHDNLVAVGITGSDLGRRLALALEIKLAFVHTTYELFQFGGIENRHVVPESDRREYLPLRDTKAFVVAMKRSRAVFSLITRVRAVWDKIFLYVTMSEDGNEAVKRLQNQRSKRKFFFTRFASGLGSVTPELMIASRNDLDELEREFRTPELHGFGSLRGWIFDPIVEYPTDEPFAIMNHWSQLSVFVTTLFKDSRTNRSSREGP